MEIPEGAAKTRAELEANTAGTESRRARNMKMKELCPMAILGLFLILNPTSADALFIGFGDPNAGGIIVNDNDGNDANKTVGVIQANNLAVANFTATGTLFALGGAGGGAIVNRLLLTNLTVQATANITNQTIAFGNDIQRAFPGATLVHLDGRYEHGGGGMIGLADIRLDGFVNSNPIVPIGTVDPLAVMNVPSPRAFTYPAGMGPDAKGNLNNRVAVTSIGGLLTFSLNNTDLFVLPNSAEVAVSESDEELFPTAVPEPSTVLLVGTALGSIVALYVRRRIHPGLTKSPR
jgi:hypothetical protein